MKKIFAPTFCTLLLCSLILITLGPTIATAQEYTRTSYYTQVIPTIDGKWTTNNEWTDGEETWIGTDIVFRTTWDIQGDVAYTRWIVEFLTDTTNDPGDYWRFCFDGNQAGGSEPSVSQRMVEITGHNEITMYIGGLGVGGSGWAASDAESQIEWADSLSASPTSDTPHWILEWQRPKIVLGVYTLHEVYNVFVQAYDQSNPGYNPWPPAADPDLPDDWGTVDESSTEPIPEGLTFAVMALLTTVSMLVGYKYFIKRKETK